MQEVSQDRVFEYSISRWRSDIIPRVIAFVLLVSIQSLDFIGAFYSSTPSAEARPSIRDIIWGVVFLTVASIYFWDILRSCLEVKRVSIRIRPDGLVITDWQSKENELPWSSITGMRIIHTSAGSEAVTLRTAGKSYELSSWLEDRQSLIDAVIAGAGLVKVKDNWIWTSYRRADAETVKSE